MEEKEKSGKKKFQWKDIFIHGPQRYDPRFQAPA